METEAASIASYLMATPVGLDKSLIDPEGYVSLDVDGDDKISTC